MADLDDAFTPLVSAEEKHRPPRADLERGSRACAAGDGREARPRCS